MKPLTLTNKAVTREALLSMAEKIEGAWIGLRIAGLLLILAGWKSTGVAKLFNLSRPSVISWIRRANEEGIASVEDKPRPGRPGKLDEKVTHTLKEALSRSPEEYGLNRFRWDGVVVVEFLEKNFSILLKPRQARNWLRKLGYVRKRPVHQYIQASDKGVVGKVWEKNLRKIRRGIQKGIKGIIVFMDEAGFSLHPKLGLVWVPKGSRPKVPTASCRKRLNVAGWVAPWVGWHGFMRIAKGNTDGFLLFLEYLHKRLKDFIVYLYADGPYWHKGERVRGVLKKYPHIHLEHCTTVPS